MDTLIDILIIIFYPLIVCLDDLGKEIGKGCLELFEMWNQFITFITNLIFKENKK